MIKKIKSLSLALGVCGAVFITACHPDAKKENYPESTVAVVNGQALSATDLMDTVSRNPRFKKPAGVDANTQDEIVNGLVSDELLFQKARTMDIDDNQSIKKAIVRNLLKEKAAEKVTDTTVRDYYTGHVDEFNEIRISHLFIAKTAAKPDPKAAIKKDDKKKTADKKALVQTVMGLLKKGKPFEAMVKKYSEDTRTAANGGDLGYITKERVNAEIWKKLSATDAGKTTDLIETAMGYHIIQVNDRRVQPLESAMALIRAKLTQQSEKQYQTELLTTLHKDVKIKTDSERLKKASI